MRIGCRALAAGACWVAALAGCGGRPGSPAPAPAIASPVTAPAPEEDATPAPFRFAESAGPSGLLHAYRNGEERERFSILESLGGGAGLLDFDGDGRLDVVVAAGGDFAAEGNTWRVAGLGQRLFRNVDGRRFEDVTERSGLGGPGDYTHGFAVGDFDDDGDPDLLVTSYQGIRLYRNDGGRFADVTGRAGLDRPGGWCTSAAWADLDGDGRLDLYVARYVDWSFADDPACRYRRADRRDICSPTIFEGLDDLLFRNRGDGTFEEVGHRAGLSPGGKGLGVAAADFDGDGRVDLYVANDTTPNFLYRNLGGGRFEEVGTASGAGLSGEGVVTGSMGVAVGDHDGDGDLDLFVTNYEGELSELYRNDGSMTFTPMALSLGLGTPTRPLVGWGTGMVDLDGDGSFEIVEVNGHLLFGAPGGERAQPTNLFRRRGGRFEDVGPACGPEVASPRMARGLALGDLDGDGAVDLVVVQQNRPVALLRNETTQAGPALRLRLEGVAGPRDAVGARVVVRAGGLELTRAVVGGGSYLSASDPRLVIGLGGAGRADEVRVEWPGGRVDRHEGLEAGPAWHLREGEAPRLIRP